MKCPECVRLELTSRFNVYTPTPDKWLRPDFPDKPVVERFFDENGKSHVHAHIERTRLYSCNNKHAYLRVSVEACPVRGCAWNDQPLVVEGQRPLGEPAPEG